MPAYSLASSILRRPFVVWGYRELPGARALASELQNRCTILQRIRRRLDAQQPTEFVMDPQVGDSLRAVLWSAYLMMLENDGKNEQQLREYAGIDNWLDQYWFHHEGASMARCAIKRDTWPHNSERNSLAMWLFWFMLRPGTFSLPVILSHLRCMLEFSDIAR